MFETTDNFTITTKRNIKKFKSTLGLLAFICFFFSIVYFIYYGLAFGTADQVFLGYTQDFFKPLAQYLHPESSGLEIYLKTGFTLLKLLVPLFVLYIISEIVQSTLLSIHDKLMEIKNENIKKRERKKYAEQFERIKYFSISATFDYTKNGSIVPPKVVNQLNKIVFEKLQSTLSKKNLKIDTSGIFAITSSNFFGYDLIYENLLKTISKIRRIINEKYSIEIIPTITTDAFAEAPSINKILTSHFAIKGCNLKNKATNTNIFCKKYNFLGLEKFIGVSIGIYNNQSTEVGYDETYDLSVVIKNLSDKLDMF